MSSNANSVPAAQLDRNAAPIFSKITIEPAADSDPAQAGVAPSDVAGAFAAFEAAIAESHSGPYTVERDAAGNALGILLPTRWEPPFKLARAISTRFLGVRVRVTADAFRAEYWLARAVFAKGRAEVEETLTFNDGEAFEKLFAEIHGEPYADWKIKNKQGGVRGGFSWGTSDDYDPEQSELGKAEGQV
ncbi:MAG: hypothetical protein LBT53_01240 [Puniceicoccales bacterium]|jgi:hypothetical protein|nr:hypothetical protein [Puniceicoccales bacterium]